jgi:hypothetical protein
MVSSWRITRNFVLFIFSILVPCGYGASPDAPMHASIIQLIASPEKYDGKLVSVTGFIHIGREQDLLFLGQEDFIHALDENALWFHLSEEMGKDWEKLNGNYVSLIGIFSSKQEGPYGCPNGGIAVVKRFAVWSTPSNPIGKALDQPKL